MKLATRLITAVVAVAICAGLALVGAAASTPTISAGAKVATVTFTATATFGGTTYAIDSTSCSLKEPGSAAISCFLGGAGNLSSKGTIEDANIVVTSTDGPITLSLGTISSCGVGSGVAIVGGTPEPVVAITSPKWGKTSPVSSVVTIYKPGTKTVTCTSSSSSSTTTTTAPAV